MKIEEQIFRVEKKSFDELAIAIFHHQYKHTAVYRRFVDALNVDPSSVSTLTDIPFLPIQFFKSYQVVSDRYDSFAQVFESSGTTGQVPSKHIVQDIQLYEESFITYFEEIYGDVRNLVILGLLPSYLERGQSSLVYMVDALIKRSEFKESGFYLHNHADLFEVLTQLEAKKQPCILIGVTYALLDFAEQYSLNLKHTKVMETGGMKGRREELIRDEVHTILKDAFQLNEIHSEYGMTELLSQAYAVKDGCFKPAPWMKVLIRDINDPFQLEKKGRGVLNIIDLANLNSCSFIATDDIGELNEDGSFYVFGRLDLSELRGCSLMVRE